MKITADAISYEPLHESGQVSSFVNETWARYYPDQAGVICWPDWFFQWQFLDADLGDAAAVIGAFFNGQLVGAISCDIWDYHHAQQVDRTSFLSGFSVQPGRTAPFVARGLFDAAVQWSEKRGSSGFFGYLNPVSNGQKGRGFWTGIRGTSAHVQQGPLLWHYRGGASACEAQAIAVSEAPWIFDALNRRAQSQSAHVNWLRPRFERQMSYAPHVTLWSVSDGRGRAACNSYMLPCHDGSISAYSDFVLSDTDNPALEGLLLGSVAQSCKELGADRFFTVGPPTNSSAALTQARFFPCMPSYTPTIGTWRPEVPGEAYPRTLSAFIFR